MYEATFRLGNGGLFMIAITLKCEVTSQGPCSALKVDAILKAVWTGPKRWS